MGSHTLWSLFDDETYAFENKDVMIAFEAEEFVYKLDLP